MSEQLTFREQLARCDGWREELRLRLKRIREAREGSAATEYSVREAVGESGTPEDLRLRAESYDRDAEVLEASGDHEQAGEFRRTAERLREEAG